MVCFCHQELFQLKLQPHYTVTESLLLQLVTVVMDENKVWKHNQKHAISVKSGQ